MGRVTCAALMAAAILMFWQALTTPAEHAMPARLWRTFVALIGEFGQTAQQQQRRRLDAWADTVEELAVSMRSGASVPEAMQQLAAHGPPVVRDDLAVATRPHAAGRGRPRWFGARGTAPDAPCGRLLACLWMTRHADVGAQADTLQTLSALLRADLELLDAQGSRSSRTVTATHLVMAAPWLVLTISTTVPGARQSYGSHSGALVLLLGGVLAILAPGFVRRISRLNSSARTPA